MIGPKSRRRGPASPIVHLGLDPDSDVPMYRQVYDGLRDAILAGRVARGARLPSSRALAADLGVARNTVLQAFDQLRSEGYLIARRGGGTRARHVVPDSLLTARASPLLGVRRTARDPRVSSRRDTRTLPQPASDMPRLSTRGAALVESGVRFLSLPSGGVRPVPFELGVPAADAFPMRLWGQLARRRWRRGDVDLGDADPAGDPTLRVAIASYLATARGVRGSADQVLVVNGAQQALHLIAQVLLDPGDAAWIEDPGYFGARMAIEAAGARLVPVPVDAEGLDADAGIRLAPNARLAYVTPSHQFPLGAVMSARRRLQLLAWARGTGAWIIEDDYDSEFRYAGRPLPSLQGLEAEQGGEDRPSHVVYVGTFSKTLASGLRLGYMVVPETLVDAFRAARSATDRHTATPYQGVLADFIGEGHYARHIRHVRNLCAERQGTLAEAAASRLGEFLTLASDPAGLHLVGKLAAGLDGVAASEAAAAHDVRAWPLSRFYLGPPAAGTESLLLGYAAYDDRQIRDAVERLRRALAQCGAHRMSAMAPITPAQRGQSHAKTPAASSP